MVHRLPPRAYAPFLLSLASTFAGETTAQWYVDASARLPPEADIVTPGGEGVDFLTNTSDVDLVDVDGDGDLDVFVADGTANIAGRPNRLYLNDGRGRFTDVSATNLPASTNDPFDPGPANSVRADAADVDGDGDLDLAIANLGDNRLLLNDGDGVFTDASDRLPAPPTGPLAGRLAVFNNISVGVGFVDLTGDGLLDLYFVNELPPIPGVGPGGSPNLLYVQRPDGTFADESAARLPDLVDATINFVTLDVDDDGDLDILEANIGQNRLLLNDGEGVFRDATAGRLPAEERSSRGIALGDLDGDGDLDFVIANSNAEQNQVFLNDGRGVFAEAAGLLPEADDTSSDVVLLDANFDGRLDVAFANSDLQFFGPGIPPAPTPAANPLYLQSRDGTFRVPQRTVLSDARAPSFELEVGDVNGDGIDDVLVANANAFPEQLLLRRRPPPPPRGAVRPLLLCVERRGPRDFTALFGYTNTGRRPYYVSRATGPNRLFGGTSGQVQPVVFKAGGTARHPEDIFAYDFTLAVGWALGDRFASWSPFADRRVENCSRLDLLAARATDPDPDPDGDGLATLLDDEPALAVSPTAAHASVVVSYGLPADARDVAVRLYDATGRLRETPLSEGSAVAGTYAVEVSTAQLAPGAYYAELSYVDEAGVERRVVPFTKL